MIRTQVQLPEEQAERLRELAAKRRVSMAKLIREGVDRVLREEVHARPSEVRGRALAVIGRFPGRVALSERHDEFFVEEHGK
jgi:Arc/MetJ-type ribon-helix-helix transcriptional regulator